MVKRAWEKFGILPGELFDRLRPNDYVTLFMRNPAAERFDKVEELTRANRERGLKGLKPAFPAWFINGEKTDG